MPNRYSLPSMMLPQRLGARRTCVALLASFMCLMVFYTYIMPCSEDPELQHDRMVPGQKVQYTYNKEHQAFPYERGMPLIFIGGIPRSGTTLMRAMLDAHPEVRCGEETRVIPRLLGMRSQWSKSTKESSRLEEAGLSEEVLDSAIAAFILEVIAKHGEPAARLCNKDPFTLNSSLYLAQMFPGSRFVLMVRDGRAVVHSIITRKVTISGFDLKSYRTCLQKWNQAMESMYYQCLKLGKSRCMIVYYEQLVLHPKDWMGNILSFLDIPWDEAVLHHDQFINIPGGVSLSKTERSTDQVIKPVNLEALTRWVGAIPEDVKRDMRSIAPMLERLGYNPSGAPPNYGDADGFVVKNTNSIKNNRPYWQALGAKVQQQGKREKLADESTGINNNHRQSSTLNNRTSTAGGSVGGGGGTGAAMDNSNTTPRPAVPSSALTQENTKKVVSEKDHR